MRVYEAGNHLGVSSGGQWRERRSVRDMLDDDDNFAKIEDGTIYAVLSKALTSMLAYDPSSPRGGLRVKWTWKPDLTSLNWTIKTRSSQPKLDLETRSSQPKMGARKWSWKWFRRCDLDLFTHRLGYNK
ncbi:hypothetical protein BsWGS_23063 [Bradybaena similaris]